MEIEKFEAGHYEQGYQYKYFVPNKICHEWVWTDPSINDLLEKAAIRLGELNSFSKLVPNIDLFIQLHVTKEAVVSSRIEGTQTKMDEALLPIEDIQPERRDDWKEVNNYIKAIDNAIEALEKLPLSELLEHVKSAEIQFTLAVKKVRDNNINSRLGINDILAAQCQHYIFEHLHERIDIKKMGDDLGYNSSYLSHHFKEVTGISLKQYILNEKIEAAKELLVYSQYKFSDIAFFLGFCSQSHLGKVFQQKTGMTLREFRREWKFGE